MVKYNEKASSKLPMTEVSRNMRKIFFHKIPPILKVEVGFFPIEFFFRKQLKLFFFGTNSEQNFSEFKEPFRITKTPDFDT